MIDTHCHLTFPEFAGRTAAVIEAAAAKGVTGMITVCTTTANAAEVLTIASNHPRVWCSAGVHPLYAGEEEHDWAALGRVIEHPRCVAWGELGLDNHYPDPPRALQHRVLEEQLAFILSRPSPVFDKPIILHCREAFDDLIPVLRNAGIAGSRCVFHCFTGTPDEARRCLDFGAMLSFTGVVTYANAKGVQDAARLAPEDRIMVETDAPFLSPAPHRGVRPCEPWMTSVTARFLADLRATPWDAFHDALDRNTERFFAIPARALRAAAPH